MPEKAPTRMMTKRDLTPMKCISCTTRPSLSGLWKIEMRNWRRKRTMRPISLRT